MKGFGRGSTELGFPTANFADEVDKFWNEERIIVFYSTGDWSIARIIDRRNLLGSCPSGWWSGLWYGRCHFLYRHLPWPCVKVMSIGWNPFYENKKRAMETHIVHKFEEADLYGRQLKVVNHIDFWVLFLPLGNTITQVIILGFIRPEQNFDSLEALIDAIR